jgi:AraC-like DNA-binding protein
LPDNRHRDIQFTTDANQPRSRETPVIEMSDHPERACTASSTTFTDPDHYASATRTDYAKLTATRTGPLRAELTKVALPRLWLQRGLFSLPGIFYWVPPGERKSIIFLTAAASPVLRDGTEVTSQQIMVSKPQLGSYARGSRGFSYNSMSLSLADIEAAARALVGRSVVVPARPNYTMRPPARLMARLQRVHRRAIDLAMSKPAVLAHPVTVRAIEDGLARAMIACLAAPFEPAFSIHPSGRARTMRRFEELLRANADWPLLLTDVCAAIGVPARTLRRHCDECLGVGPHTYLMLRRMNLARRALAHASPATTTVAEIAYNYGFSEPERFAASYRKRFGELPSATLRRLQ